MLNSKRWLALLLALAMLAAACGSDDGDDETTEVTTGQDEEEQQQVETDRAEGEATGDDTRESDSGPVRGGKLVYGIEADSANPWAHYAVSCAISCGTIRPAGVGPALVKLTLDCSKPFGEPLVLKVAPMARPSIRPI